MQIPENPNNSDICDSLVQLREELNQIRDEFGQKFEELNNKIEKITIGKSDYKFDVYGKGTDGMVRLSITIIIATASVVVLSSLSPAMIAIIRALSNKNAG
jgi:phosphoglycerate-specific signal transduction histidine kinase